MAEVREKVLLIDDDESIRRVFVNELRQMGFQMESAADIPSARHELSRFQPEMAILDLRLPSGSGADFLKEVRRDYPALQVIMLTGHAEVETAVECMRAGAFDFLTKPCALSELEMTLQRAAERLRLTEQNTALRQGHKPIRLDAGQIVGQSQAIENLRQLIGRVAPTDEAVLISSETGTGKELTAQAIWRQSLRADKAFITVNCSAVSETLLESELFGHEKGAFSGADQRRIGLFELADGGTLFLDEIGDMPMPMQAKLLRTLQSGELRRVGGGNPFHVNVRVICATNKDLEAETEEGNFREDLLHRINTLTLAVPPLRERTEDIPLLCGHILDRFANAPGGRKIPLSKEALAALQNYAWPGNVRELENVLKRAAILASEDSIGLLDLPSHIIDLRMPGDDATRDGEVLALADLERRHILRTLQQFDGNKTQTAKALGITTKTLYNKLALYGVKE